MVAISLSNFQYRLLWRECHLQHLWKIRDKFEEEEKEEEDEGLSYLWTSTHHHGHKEQQNKQKQTAQQMATYLTKKQ